MLQARVAEVASHEIVLLAVPWTQIETALSNLPPWSDRILIVATNALLSHAPDVIDRRKSNVERIAAALSKREVLAGDEVVELLADGGR